MRRGAILGMALAAASLAEAATPQVRLESGRLWVRAERMAIADVLGTVSARTGIFFDVDGSLVDGTMTLVLDGVDLERGIRSLAETLPGAAGHSMSYAPDASPAPRLIGVRVYGPGAPRPAPRDAAATQPPAAVAAPAPTPTPNAAERVDRMVAAGIPRAAAESVQDLAREVQRMQNDPNPPSYSAADLAPASRQRLAGLIERGIPVDRAVQMLLLQERYHQTIGELRRSQADPGEP